MADPCQCREVAGFFARHGVPNYQARCEACCAALIEAKNAEVRRAYELERQVESLNARLEEVRNARRGDQIDS
jgi:hypothetical protein